MPTGIFARADALRLPLKNKSVDLVLGSPPYCDARSYGIHAQRGAEEWISFMLDCTREACRISRGLVLWVVGGVSNEGCYWPACEGLLYRWWRDGGNCWRPVIWTKNGVPGSGGKQWLRADTEYVMAFKAAAGPIPWADNTAMGHVSKCPLGGAMSNRTKSGKRVRWREDKLGRIKGAHARGICKIANPGNIVHVKVGGGLIGDRLAHENEAPYPEALAEFFIRSFCPPLGRVCDPFSGSGTTVCEAVAWGRHGIGFDLRDSQVQLGRRRLSQRREQGRLYKACLCPWADQTYSPGLIAAEHQYAAYTQAMLDRGMA